MVGEGGKFFGGEGGKFHMLIITLKLGDGDTGVNIEGIGVGGLGAVLNLEIGGGGDHGGVVARESGGREKR